MALTKSKKKSYDPTFREAYRTGQGSLTLDTTKLEGPAHGIVPWNPAYKVGDKITFELFQITPWISSIFVTEENHGKEFVFPIEKEKFDFTLSRFWCAVNDAPFPAPPINLYVILE
ncbi:hypothetical protein GXB78_14075 [Pseudomonas moraviensis subsp. stanleyae]|uniref:hypothetical protein n=1 Tax=Pseudomonas moraviensis TaxID=321662 RepID=UPI002E367904|nr:hypothetical protein [Pseudomonas moraviensis]MED7668324.1 hypothetical protein [Pseudomonas moraviensis subsp. stanleyae]